MSATHTTYRQRAYLKRGGHGRLDGTFRQCAWLYNLALSRWQQAYQQDGTSVTLYEDYRGLTALRQADPAWRSCSAWLGRGVLLRLDGAKQAFFRRVKAGETPGYPKFKAGRRWRSITIPQVTPGMVTRKRGKWVVKVKGLPLLVIRPRRNLPPTADLKSIEIIRRPTGVYVSLTYAVEKQPLPATGKVVGVDMGVTDRVALSDGTAVETRWPESTKSLEQRISRCQRGSNSQGKLRRQLARRRYREGVRNRNECHRLTTDLIRRHDLVALEDLAIGNMTRSASGTVEKPGSRVAQKRGLNRSIQQQTWGLLRHQLTYKGQWYGRQVVAVPPQHSSQTCSVCGTIDPQARQGKRYDCQACGAKLDADTNAARVILQRGQLAGGTSPPSAIEPAERSG